MADPYLGQLSLVGFNFAPLSWALAAGQTLPINSNTALFSLLGTTYGGNGTSNFMLPNLQGKVPIGVGQSPGLNLYVLGETGGEQNVTLQSSQTPNHTHAPMCREINEAIQPTPIGNSFAQSASGNIYSAETSPLSPCSQNAVSTFGGNQPHNNMMPFVGMYWIIALQGIFPPRS